MRHVPSILNDRPSPQVRIIDLNRNAAKPFLSHRSRVKTLAVMDGNCVISGGEDGTVRRWDIRESKPAGAPADYLNTRSLLGMDPWNRSYSLNRSNTLIIV